MTAQEKLQLRIDQNLHICVGLDTDINKIPPHLKVDTDPLLEFNKSIIDSTCNHAAAYKINFAFYEFMGTNGWEILKKTINYIPKDILIIADAKRGDIGNTSDMYAKAVFDELKCDAVTLHPYMGYDSIEPFIKYEGKLNFILGLTSNPSSQDFEKQKLSNGKFLFQEVISFTNNWNKNNNCGLVFGATNINELEENIMSFNNMPILLPGVGAQGGSLEDVVRTFMKYSKNNYLINVSRGLIYSDDSTNFKQIVENKILEFNSVVQSLNN